MGFVIAIAGTSGAGKSTLVGELSKRLDASSLYYDAYQETTAYPEDMLKSLARGEMINPAEIRSPKFFEDLVSLKNGRKVIDPWSREVLPTDYIVVEEPFGRLREGMKEVLDFVVCLKIPLDISLARRVLRDLQIEYKELEAKKKLEIVEGFLTDYLAGLGSGYKQINDTVCESANLVVNGLKPTEEVTDLVIRSIGEEC